MQTVSAQPGHENMLLVSNATLEALWARACADIEATTFKTCCMVGHTNTSTRCNAAYYHGLLSPFIQPV